MFLLLIALFSAFAFTACGGGGNTTGTWDVSTWDNATWKP
jgi:hypothetical protein